MTTKYRNILLRVGTGLVTIPLVIGLIYWHTWSYFFLFLIILVCTMLEYYSLVSKAQISPLCIWGTLCGGLLYTFSFMYTRMIMPGIYLWLIIPMLISTYLIVLYKKNDLNPFNSIAHTFLGIVYVGIPFALLHFISFDKGVYQYELVLGILFIIWANDIGAYGIGSLLGKHQLLKRISPKKTWEGSIGGALLALLVSYVVAHYYTNWNITTWIIVGLISAIAGTYGDLVESLLKRSLQLKDSGTILPGHGGFLDRFDSFLLAVPLIVVFIQLSKR